PTSTPPPSSSDPTSPPGATLPAASTGPLTRPRPPTHPPTAGSLPAPSGRHRALGGKEAPPQRPPPHPATPTQPTTPPHPPTAGSLPAPAGDILLSAARKHGHQHPSLTPPGQLNRRSTRPLTPPRPHNRRSTRPLHPATPPPPPPPPPPHASPPPGHAHTPADSRISPFPAGDILLSAVRGEGGGLAWAGCDRARGAGAAPSGPAGEVTEAAAEA